MDGRALIWCYAFVDTITFSWFLFSYPVTGCFFLYDAALTLSYVCTLWAIDLAVVLLARIHVCHKKLEYIPMFTRTVSSGLCCS